MSRYKRQWLGRVASGAASLAVISVGCHWQNAHKPIPPVTPPAAQTRETPVQSTAPIPWENSAKGVKLVYPADWHPTPSPDYTLMLRPADADPGERRVTFDIPDLPPHLPFMIQMSRVRHDYIADLQKSHPDLEVEQTSPVQLPDAVANRVRSTWHQNGQQYSDVALLIIHASAVYILDGRTDQSHLRQTLSAFNTIESSLRWTSR